MLGEHNHTTGAETNRTEKFEVGSVFSGMRKRAGVKLVELQTKVKRIFAKFSQSRSGKVTYIKSYAKVIIA